jgi:hypothetical protein
MMEGKYTKLSAGLGLIGVIIAIWQLIPAKDKNIDGEWEMTSKICHANLEEYVGMEFKWKLYLTESDKKVSGTAEKIAVNGKDIDFNRRTSMDLVGNIKDDVLTLNYVENGRIRKTSGILITTLKNNTFTGTFSQTASDTKGEITAIKSEN